MNSEDVLKYIKEAELHFKNGWKTLEDLRKIIENSSQNNVNNSNSTENLLEENSDKRENSDKSTESDKSEIFPLLGFQTPSTDSYESNDGWQDTAKRYSKSIKDEIKKSPQKEENSGFSDDTLILSDQECRKTKSDSQKTVIVNKDENDATDEDEKQAQEIISEWMIGDDDSDSSSSKDVEISDLSDFDFEFNSKEKSKEIKLKDLQVIIDKIDVKELQKLSQKKSTSDLDEIDRLCDLSGLEKLKKTKKNNRMKISKKRYNPFKSSSESNDDSSDSDLSILNPGEENLKFDDFTKSKLDDYLAMTICEENDSGNECLSEESEDESCEENKKKVKKKSDRNKKKLTKEEMEKRSWRNDPLLTSKLTSSSSSSSSDDDDDFDSETKKRKRKNSSNSDCILNNNDQLKKMKKSDKDEIILSSDDNSDNDIEIISDTAAFQGKRRNIRHVISDENLSQLTQKALKDEQNRIDRLDSQKSTSSSSILNNKDVLISIDPELIKKLKKHQIEGVKFMWDSCYESLDRVKDDEGSGCILAHCMGLGKTLQVITLIHTLFSYEETKTERVLVVCPLSTVKNWENEVNKTFHDIPHKKFKLLSILW